MRTMLLIAMLVSGPVSAQLVCNTYAGITKCEEQDYDSDRSFTCHTFNDTTICEED